MHKILKVYRRLGSKTRADSEVSCPGPEPKAIEAESEQMDGRVIALRKVFLAVELVEHILLYLDMFDILRCTLVCTGFRDVVNRSTAIQRKLFFIPNDEPETWFCEYKLGPDHEFILKQRIANACVRPRPVNAPSKKGNMDFTPIKLNPLFKSCSGPHSPEVELDSCGFPILSRNRGPGGTCHLAYSVRDALNRSASWRRMYISHPPALVTVMRIVFAQRSDAKHRSVRHIEGTYHDNAPKVRTLGELVDLVQQHGVVGRMHRKDKSLPADWYTPGAVGKTLQKMVATDDREVCMTDYSGIICLKDCIIPSEEQWALPDPYKSRANVLHH